MLLDTAHADDFLYKYQLLMVYLNDGEIPNGKEGFAAIRPEIYECLDELEESMLEFVGSEFLSNLREAAFGEFVYLKKYKEGYVFKHIETGCYYQTLTLTTPLDEMLDEFIVVNTAIVPFRGSFVCDGLITSSNVALGKGLMKEVREGYHQAKKDGSLRRIT